MATAHPLFSTTTGLILHLNLQRGCLRPRDILPARLHVLVLLWRRFDYRSRGGPEFEANPLGEFQQLAPPKTDDLLGARGSRADGLKGISSSPLLFRRLGRESGLKFYSVSSGARVLFGIEKLEFHWPDGTGRVSPRDRTPRDLNKNLREHSAASCWRQFKFRVNLYVSRWWFMTMSRGALTTATRREITARNCLLDVEDGNVFCREGGAVERRS